MIAGNITVYIVPLLGNSTLSFDTRTHEVCLFRMVGNVSGQRSCLRSLYDSLKHRPNNMFLLLSLIFIISLTTRPTNIPCAPTLSTRQQLKRATNGTAILKKCCGNAIVSDIATSVPMHTLQEIFFV